MIECGFEFEFGHNVSVKTIKEVFKVNYLEYKIKEVYPYSSLKNRDMFIFKWDETVITNAKHNLEIATPVFKGQYSIYKNFEHIFNILKILNVITDKCCSIHINIGFSESEEIKKIDLGRLYLYIDERYYLKKFNRMNNDYCKLLISDISIRKLLNNQFLDKENIYKLSEYIKRKAKSNTKSINHHKAIGLDKSNIEEDIFDIIEFRFIGGDYINNYKECYNTLNHIINTMVGNVYWTVDEDKDNRILKRFKNI
jgi:hypothetical protein